MSLLCKRSFSSASSDVLINVQNLAVQGVIHTHRYTQTHLCTCMCVWEHECIQILCYFTDISGVQFTNNNKIYNKLYYKFHKPTDFCRLLLLIFH